jgi:hypothetical protein
MLVNVDTSNFIPLVSFYYINDILRLLKLRRLYHRVPIKELSDYLRVDSRAMRLINFLIKVIIAVHIAGCVWVYNALVNNCDEDTWVYRIGIDPSDISNLYLFGIYFALATLTTVGFGDISA